MIDVEKPVLTSNIDLEDNVKIALLFKKFIEDGDYTDLVSAKYNPKYFMQYDLNPAIAYSIKYLKKFGNVPEITALKSILNKHLDKTKYDIKKLSLLIDNAMSNTINDENLIRSSIIDFISSNSVYWILNENIEKLRNKETAVAVFKQLEDITTIDLDTDLGFDYFVELASHLDEVSKPEARLPTGYSRLDECLGGGFYKDGRCLALFVAPTHVGKSLIKSNIAVNALKQNKFVLIISCEMSELVYGSRIDAHISGNDVNTLRTHVDEVGEKIRKFEKLYIDSKLVLKEYAPNSVNCRKIATYIDKLQKKHKRKVDLVFIDYIGLVNPNIVFGQSSYERGGDVAKEMRALSYLFNCPVVSSMQLNRSGYGTDRIGMESISESMGYAHTADVICSLYQNVGDKESGIMRMGMLKNRLGGDTTTQLEFSVNYKSLRITHRKVVIEETTTSLDKDLCDELESENESDTIIPRKANLDKL